MSYAIGQYLHMINQNNNDFMNILDGQKVVTVQSAADAGVETSNAVQFINPGYQHSNIYQKGQSYYLHCEIGRMTTEQVYMVKLVNLKDLSKQQFIKMVTIQPGEANVNSMADLEFIFTPVDNFDTVLFELQRVQDDYSLARIPRILFYEVSLIKNILGTLVGAAPLIKMGIQGAPGTKMCINNEDIQIGKTGIYEIKNGIIQINFLSVVNRGEFSGTQAALDIERQNALNISYGYKCKAVANNIIPAFTLDYIYEEDE